MAAGPKRKNGELLEIEAQEEEKKIRSYEVFPKPWGLDVFISDARSNMHALFQDSIHPSVYSVPLPTE